MSSVKPTSRGENAEPTHSTSFKPILYYNLTGPKYRCLLKEGESAHLTLSFVCSDEDPLPALDSLLSDLPTQEALKTGYTAVSSHLEQWQASDRYIAQTDSSNLTVSVEIEKRRDRQIGVVLSAAVRNQRQDDFPARDAEEGRYSPESNSQRTYFTTLRRNPLRKNARDKTMQPGDSMWYSQIRFTDGKAEYSKPALLATSEEWASKQPEDNPEKDDGYTVAERARLALTSVESTSEGPSLAPAQRDAQWFDFPKIEQTSSLGKRNHGNFLADDGTADHDNRAETASSGSRTTLPGSLRPVRNVRQRKPLP